MKIAIVNVEDGIISVGFRKMASFTKSINPDTSVYYVSQGKFYTLKNVLLGKHGEWGEVKKDDLRLMAETLAKYEIVGFSSMTGYADLTANLIRHVREINPKAYIVWGGIHPIIVPHEAIKHADAICTGEGEFAFAEFLENYKSGKDFTTTKNFWFNHEGQVIKNGFRPLMTNDEMSAMPLLQYGGEGEMIFATGQGFIPMTPKHYVKENNLAYNTVWSIGCPFRCAYCGNTAFLANDKSYAKLRHASVKCIIEELRQAIAAHPHISTIVFHDDSFMALPTATIAEFASEYKKHIGIPFCVQGIIPNYVRQEKLELLLSAGLNRVRMGIQSGSENILKFYERPSPMVKVKAAATTFSNYKRYMVAPAYDIILDNPIETKQDVVDTLEMLYGLARPFTLNTFSLRIIPNTVLANRLKEKNISIDEISANYSHNFPSLANCAVYLLGTFKMPRWMFNWFLKRAEPLTAPQPLYPKLLLLCRGICLSKRAFNHLRRMDFSVFTGEFGYILWKTGFIGFWQRHVLSKFTLPVSIDPNQPPGALPTSAAS